MRTVYDSAGIDVTSTVQAYLQANRSLLIRELFWLECINFWSYNPSADPRDFFFTSSDFPIAVTKVQKDAGPPVTVNALFIPLPGKTSGKPIKRGQLSYGIGFSDQSVDVTFYPDDSLTIDGGVGIATTLTFKQAMAAGYFREAPFWIYRAYFSSSTVLLGTTLIFRGFIRGVKCQRDSVTVTLSSLLDLFQQVQAPVQTIHPGNRLAPFLPAPNPHFISSGIGVPGSTPTDLTFAPGGSPPATNAWKDKYLLCGSPFNYIPVSNRSQPVAIRIMGNEVIAGVLHIYPYEPVIPVELVMQQGITIYSQAPVDSAVGAGVNFAPGFDKVPAPESGL